MSVLLYLALDAKTIVPRQYRNHIMSYVYTTRHVILSTYCMVPEGSNLDAILKYTEKQ